MQFLVLLLSFYICISAEDGLLRVGDPGQKLGTFNFIFIFFYAAHVQSKNAQSVDKTIWYRFRLMHAAVSDRNVRAQKSLKIIMQVSGHFSSEELCCCKGSLEHCESQGLQSRCAR